MALAKVESVSLNGLSGHAIDVEVDIAEGLPSFTLLGLPDAALSESRERVRSALLNSGLPWPHKKITISLSPAWLPKSGSHFDLPIAIGLLEAQGLISTHRCSSLISLGELGLDGAIRPVRGVLPTLVSALSRGVLSAIVPSANFAEAKVLPDIEVLAFSYLSEVVSYFTTGELPVMEQISESDTTQEPLNLLDVVGQVPARHALEISAIGSHHLLLIGPPGTGKTMLAERLPSIMPELTDALSLEVSAIHSVAGSLTQRGILTRTPPFVAPHHTTTTAAMVGGGSHAVRPGAVSLAHGGVLFIDEAPECAAGVLDSLRQPLESGHVIISRSIGTVTYPADFLLVLAANPCPCGKFNGRGRACTCSSMQIRNYLKRFSGPLLDRIDIRTFVEAPTREEMASEGHGESSEVVRARVLQARLIASDRFAEEEWKVNADIPSRELRGKYRAERGGMSFLHAELEGQRLSARGFHKVLRVAWSIADSRGHMRPTQSDVEDAFALREGTFL